MSDYPEQVTLTGEQYGQLIWLAKYWKGEYEKAIQERDAVLAELEKHQEHASELGAQPVADFGVEKIVLNAEDYDAVVRAIRSPQKPSLALQQLFAKHRAWSWSDFWSRLIWGRDRLSR